MSQDRRRSMVGFEPDAHGLDVETSNRLVVAEVEAAGRACAAVAHEIAAELREVAEAYAALGQHQHAAVRAQGLRARRARAEARLRDLRSGLTSLLGAAVANGTVDPSAASARAKRLMAESMGGCL